MLTLFDIARHVRSKNAGPFWVTIDIFLDDEKAFDRLLTASWLNASKIAEIYGISSSTVKIYPIPGQNVIKISFPRRVPQGSISDRDQHSGQMFVQLLGQKV